MLLNENMVVVSQLDTDTLGAVRSVRQVCDDGRLLVADGGGNVTLVRCSGTLAKQAISAGDRVNVDASLRFALSLVPPKTTTIWFWKKCRTSPSPTSADWTSR